MDNKNIEKQFLIKRNLAAFNKAISKYYFNYTQITSLDIDGVAVLNKELTCNEFNIVFSGIGPSLNDYIVLIYLLISSLKKA